MERGCHFAVIVPCRGLTSHLDDLVLNRRAPDTAPGRWSMQHESCPLEAGAWSMQHESNGVDHSALSRTPPSASLCRTRGRSKSTSAMSRSAKLSPNSRVSIGLAGSCPPR